MSGFLTKKIINLLSPIRLEEEREQVCGCDFAPCFEEIVFADADATGDFWKADKSDFLWLKTVTADTVTFEIWKGCRKVANASGSYGDFYAPFANAPLYSGFVADWTSIYNAFGGGKYKIKIQVTNFGQNYTFESRCFRLMPYSPSLAHGTVRLEGYQTGNVIGLDVDYSQLLTDLPNGWYSSIRIPARFGDKTPTLEVDEYLSSAYRVTQNRNQVINEYTLESKILPASVSNRITQDTILANSMLVTSHDLYATEIYRRKEVVPTAFSEVAHFQEQGAKYIVTFRDRVQNQIKRNF